MRSDDDWSGERDSGQGSRIRYTRRRALVVAGAFTAGVLAVIAGLRTIGGSAASSVGGALGKALGPFPVRSVERVPDVPAESWVITVDGLVERPLTIDRATWLSLQRMDETVDFHCVEGWTVDDLRWGGVAPSVLLERAGVKPEGAWVVFHASGDVYRSSVPLELVNDAQTMLADTVNDEPLPAEHGGPVRLVVPKQLAYKSVKWVTRLEVVSAPRAGYWEQRGYPEDAPIPRR